MYRCGNVEVLISREGETKIALRCVRSDSEKQKNLHQQ